MKLPIYFNIELNMSYVTHTLFFYLHKKLTTFLVLEHAPLSWQLHKSNNEIYVVIHNNPISMLLNAQRQISKKWFFEKYWSRDKSCPF